MWLEAKIDHAQVHLEATKNSVTLVKENGLAIEMVK